MSSLRFIRLYFRYLGLSLHGQMQYRGSFLMLAAGTFLTNGMEFLGVWALFLRFGSLRGWSLPEVALLYGMVSISFALAEGIGRGFDLFPNLVKSGDFDRLLLRPVSTALQVAGQELQLMRLGRLAQGAVILGFALHALHLHWTAWKELLLFAAILGGACLFYGLFVLQATMSFWTVETLELMNTVTYGGIETAQYPLSIYRPWFREFFTWVVPLAAVTFFPAHAILGLAEPGAPAPAVQWLSPLIGVLFLAIALQVWKVGERHYRSTGS